jgi:hypothetical protein
LILNFKKYKYSHVILVFYLYVIALILKIL